MCASLKQARAQIELLLNRVSKVGNLTLTEAAARFNLPQEVVQRIALSEYKAKTLRQLIVDLGTPAGIKMLQSEIILSSFGSVTFNQIFDGIQKNFSRFKVPASFREYGDYTLNDLADCLVA